MSEEDREAMERAYERIAWPEDDRRVAFEAGWLAHASHARATEDEKDEMDDARATNAEARFPPPHRAAVEMK